MTSSIGTARTPRDSARASLIEYVGGGKPACSPDMKEIALAFLERGDFLDAGVLIRVLEVSASKEGAVAHTQLAAAVAGAGQYKDHEQPVTAARLRALRKWVRLFPASVPTQASLTLSALLSADDLILRRTLKSDQAANDDWSEWALDTVLSPHPHSPLLFERPVELAFLATSRSGRTREFAARLACSLLWPTPSWGTALLRTLSVRTRLAQGSP